MNSIIYNYNTSIEEFKNSVKKTSATSIVNNINLLSRFESLLLIFNLRFKDIRYGKKFLKLLEKLHETQFRISILENSANQESIVDYLTFLKKQESDYVLQIRDFNYRNELKFPAVRKKNIIMSDMYYSKAEKYLKKIEKFIAIQSNDIEVDVDIILRRLNKFNKYVLASSYLNIIEMEKLSVVNSSLKQLNDIINYDGLISALYTYYKNNEELVEDFIDMLEHEKMMLVDEFESMKNTLLDNCKSIVNEMESRNITKNTNSTKEIKSFLKKKSMLNLEVSPSA